MKLPGNLLQAMALSVTLSAITVSSHKNDVNSEVPGIEKEKEKKERGTKKPDNYCPACGMG